MPPSASETGRSSHQAAWRDQNAREIKARRQKRLALLDQRRDAIRGATDAYRAVDIGAEPRILIDRDFIAESPARLWNDDHDEPLDSIGKLKSRERALARPPLMRVAHRKSNALALYLTAAYLARQEQKAGRAFLNTRHNVRESADGRPSWLLLAGLAMQGNERARRARVWRALDELVAAGLVNIGPLGSRGRYEQWTLLEGNGRGAPYRVPGRSAYGSVQLPASFFYNGWHLALEPGELVILLVIAHRSSVRGYTAYSKPWISLPQSVREMTYRLSGEMYLHAHQLVEFGLVEFRDPMPNRRRGKLKFKEDTPVGVTDPSGMGSDFTPLPYEFRLASEKVFASKAFDVVRRTLVALPLPSRLDSHGAIARPQRYVEYKLKNQVKSLPR